LRPTHVLADGVAGGRVAIGRAIRRGVSGKRGRSVSRWVGELQRAADLGFEQGLPNLGTAATAPGRRRAKARAGRGVDRSRAPAGRIGWSVQTNIMCYIGRPIVPFGDPNAPSASGGRTDWAYGVLEHPAHPCYVAGSVVTPSYRDRPNTC
jgi:hypothetical protein